MRAKIILSMLVIMVVIAATLGATYAWFTDESEAIENVFTAGTVEIGAEETEFITDGFHALNWNPGDCAEKEYTITNVGTKSIRLRGKVETQWYEWTGEGEPQSFEENPDGWEEWDPIDDGGYTEDAATVTLLELDPAQKWSSHDDDDGNTYWVYDESIDGTYVEDSDDSDPVEVTLSLKVCLDGPKAGNEYQGKTFTVNVTFQSIQASHDDQWDWDNIDFETGLELEE